MARRIIPVLLALIALVGIGITIYYFNLTAPVQISNTPPVAATLVVSSTPEATQGKGNTRVYSIDAKQSVASYRVDETFFDFRGLVTVTGTTGAVAGDILVDSSNLANSQVGEIVVDISQLRTDDSNRDNAIRREWLQSALYPLAKFKNVQISNMPADVEDGKPFQFKMTGDLTVREATQRVTWDVMATLEGDTLSGKATTQIKMTQFGFQPPSLSALEVEDDVVLTLDFVAVAADVADPTGSGEGAAADCAPNGRGPTRTMPIDDAPVRSSVGTGHVLTGVVRSSKGCAPIEGAKLIIWLANPQGIYDDDHRGMVFTDASGKYRFESNFPGIYSEMPIPHIHLHISAEGHRGVEQEYHPKEGQTEGTFDVVLAPE
jgi:polyisoprenoid-binding protein YceI